MSYCDYGDYDRPVVYNVRQHRARVWFGFLRRLVAICKGRRK